MATKTLTKKAVVVKKTKAADQFTVKKIGANVIASFKGKTIPGIKMSKENYEVLTKKVVVYNKKPSSTGEKIIMKLLTPVTTKKKEEVEATEAKIKGYKKLQKKEEKKTKVDKIVKIDLMKALEEDLEANKDNVAKVQAILNKFKTIAEPEKQQSSYRRGGEY